MPSIDDQLKERMRGAAPRPAGADDLFVRLGARKRRRATTRRVGTVGLVVVVLAGTVGGFALLGRAFRTTQQTPAGPGVTNGALVVNITNEDAYWLSVLPASKQDLTPEDGAVAADREQMRSLVGRTGSDRDVEPAVSPDGTTVAFVHHDFKGPGSLWTVNMDGSKPKMIVPDPVDAASPAWSPDGSWIVFGATRVEGRPLGFVRPDGTGLVYPQSPADAGQPSWSPDGSEIVFSAASPTDRSVVSHDLWVAGFDPDLQILTDLRQLTSTDSVDETDPVWSPDGTSIDFVTPDGIEQMPANGGENEVVVPTSPLNEGRVPTSPAWSPDGSYLTFVLQAPTPLASTVYVLPVGGTDAFPLAVGWSYAWQPVPASASPSLSSDLGVGFPICHIMSMPITVGGTTGSAYVFTKEDTNCPKPGEGDRFVAADLTGDGAVDTPPIQLDGCFPPVGCEAFAAPDVNGDGTSEVAVSNAGADGYGVWLFALTTSSPAVVPVDVVNPQGIGYVHDGRLEFAWVDVAGHAEGASCATSAEGLNLSIFGYDKFQRETEVRTTALHLVGATATVTDASRQTIPLSGAPTPGHELCGAPLQGSAADFPNATDSNVAGTS